MDKNLNVGIIMKKSMFFYLNCMGISCANKAINTEF